MYSVAQDKRKLVIFYLLFLLNSRVYFCLAQGNIAEYEDSSSKDMMEHDPNIVNPINQEGYGENIPTTIRESQGSSLTNL